MRTAGLEEATNLTITPLSLNIHRYVEKTISRSIHDTFINILTSNLSIH